MAFKVTRDDGATWIPEAGGYVKDGKVVSTTPEYSGSSSSSKSSSSKSGSSSKSSSSKSSTGSTSGTSKTYVKDAQGNIYERKYNKEAGTYVDYYVAPASQAIYITQWKGTLTKIQVIDRVITTQLRELFTTLVLPLLALVENKIGDGSNRFRSNRFRSNRFRSNRFHLRIRLMA